MRVLLFGTNGPVGWEAERSLATLGDVWGYDYPQVDFSRLTQLRSLVLETKPDVIINTMCSSSCDQAEDDSDQIGVVSSDVAGVLAEAARTLDAGIIHFSTSDVFNGCKNDSYCEEDIPNPINPFGQSMLDGERAVAQAANAYLIFRTNWVYGRRRDDFISMVQQWSRRHRRMRMVANQVGNPTWARMLAEATAQVLCMGVEDITGWLSECAGLYHLACLGSAKRCEWAQAILDLDPQREEQVYSEIQPEIWAIDPQPIECPLNTSLDCSWFFDRFGLSLPDWMTALRLALRA